MLVSKYKDRIQSKFKGGNSLSVDWYENLQEAGEMLREEITPPSLKRVVPIYGGLNIDTDIYYCPADVDVPSALYNNFNRNEVWEYMPPEAYHRSQQDYKFTIEEINGVRFLLVRHAKASGSLIIDDFDEVGNKTGVTLSENNFNYLSGVGSLEGTFSNVLTDVTETLSSVIDITDYKRGVALFGANFIDVSKVAGVKLFLYTDASNYYEMSSLVDSVGDQLIDRWNRIRFEIANASKTGTPTDTNITSYKLEITMNSGESQIVILDRLSLEKTTFYSFEYFSKYLIRDKDDNSWKEEADDDADIINLGTKEASIIVYEGCRLVGLGATKKNKTEDFDSELSRKYNAYWARNPSSELPPSYNASPRVGKRLNIYENNINRTTNQNDN